MVASRDLVFTASGFDSPLWLPIIKWYHIHLTFSKSIIYVKFFIIVN
jgi:hypothetical protein